MSMSRRTLLSMVPAATLVAAARPGRALAAADNDEHTTVIGITVTMFAGTAASNARPEVAAKLASIVAAARTRLAALDGAGPGELSRGVPLGTSDPNLTSSFQYLYEIALATRAPGSPSDLLDSAAVQDRVIDGLGWLYDHYYGDQATGYYGNWFNWEIGISSHVSKILVLLDERIAAS